MPSEGFGREKTKANLNGQLLQQRGTPEQS